MRTLEQIIERNRAGEAVGLPVYCSAQPETLRAVLAEYAHDDEPVLLAASANQVNQFGGYAGMTPSGFRNFIDILAAGEGVDPARIMLAGAHLGPYPWRDEPAAQAMDRAKDLVRAYVDAGFETLHLNATISCADDEPLSDEEMAQRAATLCAVAEVSSGGRPLRYVLTAGTSRPGGETGGLDRLLPATPQSVQLNLEHIEAAFAAIDLRGALDRVIAVVAEPGASFDNSLVRGFDPNRIAGLGDVILAIPEAVFEAAAADYQTEAGLAALVAHHFAILKVGPELGLAFRQAVVAMAHLEGFLDVHPSGLLSIIDDEMAFDPADWQEHVAADDRASAMRLFGLSDRVRYFWARPRIAAALQTLFANIDAARPEAGLIAQYVPADLPGIDPHLPLSTRMIRSQVGAVVRKLRRATRSTPI